LSCKDVTHLVSESMDRTLPLGKRVGVRLHLLVCRFCERYRRQLLLLRETARHLAMTGERPGEPFPEALSREARERIRRSLSTP
ncbi:MAG TPA: hypothetical protein VF847_05575, partial [Candidatus Deferrimicrobiaceae bacterium]